MEAHPKEAYEGNKTRVTFKFDSEEFKVARTKLKGMF